MRLPHSLRLRPFVFAILAAPSLLFSQVVYDSVAPSVTFWGHDIYNMATYSVSSGQTLRIVLPTGYSNANQAGVISGDGNVSVQSELRTVTFSGANTYTGSTSLYAYTILQIGDGGTTGSLASYLVYMDRAFLRFNHSNDFIFSSNIDGTGEIRQQGTGTTILTGNVTLGAWTGAPMNLSGAITIASGALQIGNGGTAGAVTANIVNNASLIFNRSDAYTFSNTISGSGSVVQKGAGVLTLSGTNTYLGGTTINAGLINFSSADNLGAGAITLDGGGLQWAPGNTADVSSRLTDLGSSGATFDTNGNNVSFASALSGTGSLTKTGSGTLTLAGTNTYTGATALNGGLVNFASFASLGSGSITINGGGLQWATGNTTDLTASSRYDRVVGAAGATFDTNGNNVSFSSALSGTGGLIKAGSGTLTLAADNTYSGGTTINAGTLQLGSGGSTGSVSGNIVDNGNLTFNRSDAVTLSNLISGSGTVTQSGSGTLTLSTANTYTGGTVLNAGTLGLGTNNAIGTGTLTINGGNLRAVGSARTLANNVVLSGDFTLGRLTNLAGNIALTKNITLTSANPDTGSATTSTLSGIISGNYGITFADGTNPIGAIVLSGANTYTGNTTLQSGTLTLAHSLALQNSTFNYSGGSLGFGALTSATFGGLAGTQSLALTNASSGAVALTVGGNNASTTYSGVLSGAGSLTKNGSGTLSLSGTNTFSGGTTINAGLVNFTAADNFGSGALTLNGGGLQWATGSTADISSHLASLGSSGATFNTNGNNVTFASALTGSGSLTKTGSGTLTLSAANTYTGNTTVAGGTLALAGGNDRLATTGTLSLTNGATFDLGGNSQTLAGLGSASSRLVGNITAGTLAPTGNSYLQSGSYANTWTGSSATGRLWIGGDSSATVTLNGTNDAVYTADHNQVIIGYTSITGAAGTVKLGNANALAAATENVQVFSGTLDLNGQTGVRANSISLSSGSASTLVNNDTTHAASYAGAVTVTDNSRLGGNGNLTLSGSLSGTSFEKTGYGTLTLSKGDFFADPNAYRQVTLTGGTLALTGTTFAFGDYINNGTGAEFDFNAGTLKFSSAGATTATGGYYTDSQSYADADWGGMRFDTAGQNVTLSNAVFYGTALVKTGAGTLTLADTGSAYYGYGQTYLNEGTLALTKPGQLGTSGLTLGHQYNATSGALDLGGTTQTLSPGAETNLYGGSITNGTLATDGQLFVWGTATLNATFTGSGSSARLWINANAGNTVYLGGSNERVFSSDHNQVIIGYSGNPTVKLLSSTALAAATENVEVWTGTLDLNGQSAVRANSLVLKSGAASALVNSSATAASFAGGVTLSSAASLLGGTGNLALSGVLSDTGGFTKIGTGTLTLSGANTYTGATAVNAGTLRVNGSLANTAVTVASGATLGGSGSIGGPTEFLSGAHLAPGNSPGTLTFTNGLTLDAGAILDFELGTTSDLIRISGGTITGPTSGTITLNLTDSGGFTAASYTLFDFSGAATSSFDASDFTLGSTISGYTYQLSLVGSTLQLVATASAVPEPATYALILGALTFALVAWRRRKGALSSGRDSH
ncbi:MAG: autotransporter-associated beta strand repeat-containing protein [Opitutae bacterium]|nr:autotransporter-associated beta strand repeat-containing protein [Opitutae bacterium]